MACRFMVACRFIVIKKPFLSKSQNTFPGERGTLPKAGNHSPVKFLDLSSDFPGSHRGTTARLTGTLSPGLRPAQVPPETHSPAPPEPSRLIFYPAPAPTGEPPPGSPELSRPGSRPARIPSETRDPALPEPSRLNFYPAPAPHRATAARHTGTHSSQLPPGPNPSRDPQPSATGTIPAHFPPGPGPPKGNHCPAPPELTPPGPNPSRDPRPGTPELTRPGSRPAPVSPETHGLAPPEPSRLNFYPAQLPQRETIARHTGTHSSQLPPGPSLSRDPRPGSTGTIPAHFPPGASPKAPPGSRFAFSPKGRSARPSRTREAGSPPPREIMSIKGYKAVTFYHKSAAFAREGKEFPAYFRNPRSFWGDFGRFPGFFGLFPGDFGLFPSPSGRFGAVFFRERLTRKPDWAIIVADCFRGPAPDPLV